MIWNCSICLCRLEGNKSCSCTPCGHVFHTDCLKGWITTSQTCPECRRKVSQFNAIKLYPFEKSLDVTLENSTLEYEFFVAKDEVKEKTEEIKTLKAQIEELKIYVATAESRAESFRQQKMESENKLHVANMRLKKMKDLEQQIRNLEISLADSTAELDTYKNIKTIVHGQQQEVDQILHEAQENDSKGEKELAVSTKQLATYCSILKREFNNMVATKSSLKDEVASLKNKNFSLNQKHLRMREMCETLKQQVLQLEKENLNVGPIVCPNCPSTSSSNNANIPDLKASTSNFNNSPISVNFGESKKKIDVLVLDDDTCYKKLPSTSKFISRRGQDGIATRIDYGSCFGRSQDPKLMRRIKVNQNDYIKKHPLVKNIVRR